MAASQQQIGDIQKKKSLGQVFTPCVVAHHMVNWATYQYTTESFLDPGVGEGVFTKELISHRKELERTSKLRVDCIDVDRDILNIARANLTRTNGEEINFFLQDFLSFTTQRRYQSIVCNPPYFKHHYVENKVETVQKLGQLTGYKLPITTNIYCLFMFRARALMADKARCAFIVPTEFLNADYGVQVKHHLMSDYAFKGIIGFHFNTLVFDDALTTASIVLFETSVEHSNAVFISLNNPDDLPDAFKEFDSPVASSKTLIYEKRNLEPERKWKNYFTRRIVQGAHKLVALKKYTRCSRGIATGANDYFTFTESKRLQYEIPEDDVLKCIARSSDVGKYVFTKEDFRQLKDNDSRVYLLNPRIPTSGPVEKYIEKGESDGVNKKYLPSHRQTWFVPERQQPASIWVMVFSRGKTRFIWNRAQVNHLTTFHGIYPNLLGTSFLNPLLLYLWSDICQFHMEEQQRQYGAGLKKYEPRDIERVLIPDLEVANTSWLSQAAGLVAEIAKTKDENGISEDIDAFLRRTWLS